MKKINQILVILFTVFSIAGAQDTIRFINPSFEGISSCCRTPEGWKSIDFAGNTPPDVQPNGGFGVIRKPYHGNTYLGMVARADGTYETVYQKLDTPLVPNECYVFSIYLSQSPKYESATRSRPDKVINFLDPIQLQILAGHSPDDPKLEILNFSSSIDHPEWIEYVFQFEPSEDYSYFFLSAYYPDGRLHNSNGHILLDLISDILPCTFRDN